MNHTHTKECFGPTGCTESLLRAERDKALSDWLYSPQENAASRGADVDDLAVAFTAGWNAALASGFGKDAR